MKKISSAALFVAAACAMQVASAQTTVTFQEGANGYTGAFDMRISSNIDQDGLLGADVASYFLDGRSSNAGSSPNTQGLLRFDNIIGNGAGQIPQGATILEASLTVTTSLSGNAQTSGPYGVAGLNQAFTDLTTYSDFPLNDINASFPIDGGRGVWYQDGYATRPVGGFGFQLPGQRDTADITSVVQGWSDNPANNFGLVLGAGMSSDETANANTTDGWSIRTTGFPFIDSRPQLNVTYTTNPIEVNTFQQGVGGYTSSEMGLVRSGFNALIEDTADFEIPEFTEDAGALESAFLDGVFFTDTAGNTSSQDNFLLMQFGNVFGAAVGQSPDDVPVAKAFVVLTTEETDNNARSPGPYSAHTVLRSWDLTPGSETLHSDFGAQNGLQVGDGDISEALDIQDGMSRGSEVWFDITEYLEGVRNGATDNGIAIIANGTSDGWGVYANGSTDTSLRPRLVVLSGDLTTETQLAGDFNGDGTVDAGDYTLWRDNLGSSFDLGGNGDDTGASLGVVDQADYDLWRANFGNTSGGGPLAVGTGNGAVPEPATVVLAIVGGLGLLACRKR